jgi:hypothetical protein
MSSTVNKGSPYSGFQPPGGHVDTPAVFNMSLTNKKEPSPPDFDAAVHNWYDVNKRAVEAHVMGYPGNKWNYLYPLDLSKMPGKPYGDTYISWANSDWALLAKEKKHGPHAYDQGFAVAPEGGGSYSARLNGVPVNSDSEYAAALYKFMTESPAAYLPLATSLTSSLTFDAPQVQQPVPIPPPPAPVTLRPTITPRPVQAVPIPSTPLQTFNSNVAYIHGQGANFFSLPDVVAPVNLPQSNLPKMIAEQQQYFAQTRSGYVVQDYDQWQHGKNGLYLPYEGEPLYNSSTVHDQVAARQQIPFALAQAASDYMRRYIKQ